ncbi:MAG: hypothetical protein AAGD07_14400 [Planctomycetota bacterium]
MFRLPSVIDVEMNDAALASTVDALPGRRTALLNQHWNPESE